MRFPQNFGRLLIFVTLAFCVAQAHGQQLDVTFRWIPDRPVVRAFLPGEFNGWGPNSGGRIASTAPSLMTFDSTTGEWYYTHTLEIGDTYQYKVHVHLNESGSSNVWITDPLNDRTNPSEHNNSVVTISDPMVFQLALRRNSEGAVTGLSAGVFATRDLAELTFAMNGQEQDGLAYYTDGIFHFELDAPAACDLAFTLTAVDSEGNTVSHTVGKIPPSVVDAPRPEGIMDGVNYNSQDPTQATLSVFAPGKCYMYAVGEFTGWEANQSGLMNRDAAAKDSIHWWLTLEGLDPGQQIGYQYETDDGVRFADLFSEMILDPVHDRSIPSATYPQLKVYPHGRTQGPVSVLQTSQQPYAWKVNDFEPPAPEELVIYELLVRDFLHEHDWTTLTDTLTYLQHLGINAIELMPVAEFGGNINWGYQPNFYFAPDKYYGPAEDLKRFVDTAHELGIAVILDVVYNHADIPSPLITLYGAKDSNPWINIPPRHAYNVFFDLNHEDPYTQYWLDRANAYWLTEFRVDGFRFDLSKGFTQRNTGSDWAAWDSYDASRIRLIKRMANRMWSVNPNAYIILEHWTRDREERELAGYGVDQGLPGMMVWANVTHQFSEAVMGYNGGNNSDFSRTYYGDGGRGWELPHVITYMESHDEQWLMYKMRQYGACERSPSGGDLCDPSLAANSGTYNVRHLPIALDRLKMAGAFYFLLPGPRMLWQFGELGYGYGDRGEECLEPNDCPPYAPSRIAPKPIRWDYYYDPLRKRLYDTWSALINLRHNYPVFHSTESEVALSLAGPVKRIHLRNADTDMEAVIIGNFGVTPERNRLGLGVPPVYWYDFFSGDSLNATGNIPSMLQPGEFHVYTSKPVPRPPEGLITVDRQSSEPQVSRFTLLSNYPNPFRDQTNIQFSLDRAQPVRIEVFDVLGRRITRLVDEVLLSGTHSVTLDAVSLPSGLYTVLMSGESSIASLPVLLVR